MSIISKEIAKQHLEMWLKAEEAVSTGQSYQIEQIRLRASLKQSGKAFPLGGQGGRSRAGGTGGGQDRIVPFRPA